ncbi:MAG: hypothetical protein JSV89_01060 [Spirochaetaceae bacterium]|nr:MAG: hypothetical protein JSV89_01060 [Spirochaetaceae bacterium]
MISFITAFALLLVPILILLIVRVRRRERIVYTHTFLTPISDRRLRELLLRTFQLYYDVAADLLLALLLALLLSGVLDLSPRRVAVCLDGSYSMTQGQPRSSLDRALGILSNGELGSRRYRLFVAGFDPRTNRHRLYDLGRQRAGGQSVEALKQRLASLPVFFSSDPQIVAELLQRGYGRVVYLTDRTTGDASGLEVVEVGEEPRSFFYPLSVDYREEEGSFRLRLLRQRFSDPIRLWRYDEGQDAYRLLQTIRTEESSGPLSEVRLEREGLYRLSSGELDFLLPLSRLTLRVRAEGPFSSLMAEILPGIEPGAEGILLADIAWRADEPESINRAIANRHGILTLIPEAQGDPAPDFRPHIHSLRDSLSQPTYTELPPEIPKLDREEDRVFFQDPPRIRDAGTPLVYLSALWFRRPGSPWLKPGAPASGARLSPSRSGTTSFAYRSSDQTLVVNLPPEEFFPLDPVEGYSFPEPAGPRLLPALLLMLLYLLKLLYLARLHGRS